MAKVIITEQYLEDIADAIRAKNGSQDTYYPSEMADAIEAIDTSGVTINNQNKTVNPSTSQQSITADSGYTGLGTVTVNAMPTGTAGTPSASKGTVSNHSISVTPSVTNTTGYITGSTKTGTAVTISASELVSGTLSVTTNGTKDVTNYASVNVSVSSDAPTLQAKTYTVTSAGTSTVTADNGYDGLSSVAVSVPEGELYLIPQSEFYTESNTRKFRYRGTAYVNPFDDEGTPGYIEEGSYYGGWTNINAIAKNTTITPTESAQTIGGYEYMMEGAVTVNAIPSNYVGSGITRRDSTDLSASGATVTVPSGYYSSNATKSVTSGSATGPSSLSGSSATITTGTNTITLTKTGVTTTPTVSAGYVSSATASTATVALTASVTVNPTPTASGATVTIPAGYYSTQTTKSVANGSAGTPTATKVVDTDDASALITPSVTNTTGYITGGTKTGTPFYVTARELVSGITVTCDEARNWDVAEVETLVVPSGTAGTPTATKGTVSNHSISVTPSVTNTSGYITGSTKTGTAVTVTASELASGNKAITQNGTGIDVVGYSTVSVNVSNNDVWKPIQAQTRTIIEDPNGNYLWYDGTSPDFAEGQTWRVTWGNETYIVQTKYGALSGGTGWFLGNPGAVGETDDGSGYTWFAWNQNSGAIAIGTSETGSKKVILELQQSNPYQAKTVTYTPSETQQTATVVPDSGYNGLSTVGITVNAISSTYVGSGIARKSSTDLTVSGATVTAPAGYYSAAASKSVTTMTLPTSAAASATSGYTSKATISRSTSDQYINIAPGYNSAGGYYKISAVANGSATGPSSLSGSSATVSTGTNTLTLTKTGVTTTPTVTAGYVSSATASTATVTLTASVTTKAAATITPTTTNQTIAAGTYLTGAQTIVGDADLVGSNILSTANIFGVQGTVDFIDIYIRSAAPTSSVGSDGDIYIQE